MPIELIEQKLLSRWLQTTPRSPLQINEPFASDCELVRLDEHRTLAITTDTICEEIAMGLYRDPYTMGWIAATASLSDLAAAGAIPWGVLLSASFPHQTNNPFRSRVSLGFCDALNLAQTHLLGGDTSSGRDTVLTSTGIGICNERPITRIGAKAGDFLVLTGKSGIGPALAYRLLLPIDESAEMLEQRYRPAISSEASGQLARHAHAMIDTSDGILSAVTTLCALNGVGVRLKWNPDVLDEDAVAFCRKHQLPLWALWVAEHGDYQLVGVVARERLHEVQSSDCDVIGEITGSNTFELQVGEQKRAIDPSWGQLLALTHRSEFPARCSTLLNEFRELDFP